MFLVEMCGIPYARGAILWGGLETLTCSYLYSSLSKVKLLLNPVALMMPVLET